MGQIRKNGLLVNTTNRVNSCTWVLLNVPNIGFKEFRVHLLVLESYSNQYKAGMRVFRSDGNRYNNSIDNLIFTCPDSAKYAKCTAKQVVEILNLIDTISVVDIAKRYNVSIGTIYNIIKKHKRN